MSYVLINNDKILVNEGKLEIKYTHKIKSFNEIIGLNKLTNLKELPNNQVFDLNIKTLESLPCPIQLKCSVRLTRLRPPGHPA